ncbi:MAG: hypothetical protein QM537_03115 [Candidatus Symbiobacter sp.]|nr:hypothetical protein [Candidatus Symbiobacter sp.]
MKNLSALTLSLALFVIVINGKSYEVPKVPFCTGGVLDKYFGCYTS